MAKVIEYDVEGVEASSGGTGVKRKPGLVVAKIMKCELRDKKRDGTVANDIEVAFAVGEEYDWVFEYVGLDPSSDWKLAEFVRALKLKEKGKLDPKKQEGKLLRLKLNHGEWNGSYRPEVGRMMPPQPEDEYGSGVSEVAAAAATNGEGDPTDVEPGTTETGFVPSRETDPEIGSYEDEEGWPDADLEAEVEDRGLSLPGGRGSKRAKCIAALRADDEAQANGDGDGAEEPAAEAEPAAEGDDADYDDWDLDRLKGEWEARQMGDVPVFRGSGAGDRVKAAIVEALRADDAENPFE